MQGPKTNTHKRCRKNPALQIGCGTDLCLFAEMAGHSTDGVNWFTGARLQTNHESGVIKRKLIKKIDNKGLHV